jgi:hypothetical protein
MNQMTAISWSRTKTRWMGNGTCTALIVSKICMFGISTNLRSWSRLIRSCTRTIIAECLGRAGYRPKGDLFTGTHQGKSSFRLGMSQRKKLSKCGSRGVRSIYPDPEGESMGHREAARPPLFSKCSAMNLYTICIEYVYPVYFCSCARGIRWESPTPTDRTSSAQDCPAKIPFSRKTPKLGSISA